MVNGKILYSGEVNISGRRKTELDTAAKKWFKEYFKYYQEIATHAGDTTDAVLSRGALEYKVSPGLINIPYYAVITIDISCHDNYFDYKIYDISFRPRNGMLNSIGYQKNPEYLLKLYKQKHIGFITSMSVDRSMIRDYIFNMNAAIEACIASLNKAMLNY